LPPGKLSGSFTHINAPLPPVISDPVVTYSPYTLGSDGQFVINGMHLANPTGYRITDPQNLYIWGSLWVDANQGSDTKIVLHGTPSGTLRAGPNQVVILITTASGTTSSRPTTVTYAT
jgi:hypothetical protein